MVYIYTNEYKSDIIDALSSVEGLLASVQVQPLSTIDDRFSHIVIDNGVIQTALSWSNEEPPILFTDLKFQADDLTCILLCKLGYEEEALGFTKNEVLIEEIKCSLQLKNLENQLALQLQGDDYISLHNRAIINHYAGHFHNGMHPEALYSQAIAKAPSDEHKAFTAKHLAVLLMDQGDYFQAEKILKHYEALAFSEQAKYHLALDLIQIQLGSISPDLDKARLDEIKKLIWDTLQYFEQKEIPWAVASLYTQASEITNFEKSYAESLGYITKALTIYQDQHYPEFLASAYMQKGTLLYTWAQDGNPQFYQSAVDTYQEALKIFTRETYPHAYAEVHHNLAVIYAEMPTDEKKKAMWAAFSATSFKECLTYYDKTVYPYEYAMVANNYGNALLKYPPAKTGDNIEKAVSYHLEALDIRTAAEYPIERAHSILNYLEACWRAQNINKSMERARYKDMIAKAKEVKSLTDQEDLIDQAKEHLDQLNGLAISILKD
ncbi:MAG: hypothetical protein RIG77_06570 [Cyclobacteriaceae bacterium]